MLRRRLGSTFWLAAIVVLALGLPARGDAQVIVKVSDTVNFRFGMQFQGWAEWIQDPNSQGYSQNFLIRRIRFQVLANVAPNLSVYYQTDNPRYGNSGTNGVKTINTGLLTQDAYFEWKIAGEQFMLDGGLFLVPTSRNGLTGTTTYLGLDIGTWAIQSNTIEQGNGGRDYGAGFKGYLLGDHLEYRLAAFDGNRLGTTTQKAPLGPEAGSRNPFRVAGRVNYNFFDVEKGYVLAGTNRGTKRVVAIGAWGDGQNTFKAYGADAIFDWPIAKDAVTVTANYQHFDGGSKNPSLAKQNDFYGDAGYYFAALKLQPFFRYETLNFTDDINKPRNIAKYGGGLNYYIAAQNFKISAFYERTVPKTQPVTALVKDTNRFVVQFQAFYF